MRTLAKTVVTSLMLSLLVVSVSAAQVPEAPMLELERTGPWRTWEVEVYPSGRAVSRYHNPGPAPTRRTIAKDNSRGPR